MAETGIRIAVEPCPIVQLECWDHTGAAFNDAILANPSIPVPGEIGEIADFGGLQAVRLAPRRCWLIGECVPVPPMDPELGCALSLGEGRIRLRLRGRRLTDLLSACMAIDWDAPQAAPGRAVQTGFRNVPVLMLRMAPDACDLLVPRSFERSLSEWICDLATSCD